LHKILEELDFQNESGFSEIIGKAFAQFGFSAPEFGGCVAETLQKVVTVPLGSGQRDAGSTLDAKDNFTFSQIAREQRVCELEFHFPIAYISPELLRKHFATQGKPDRQPGLRTTPHLGDHFPEVIGRLNFSPARGFLKGFIDLVFQHDGRFYIVDWKSNWLGGEAAAYHAKAMEAEMRKNCYHLQYRLYCVALHRYLSLRLPGYDYEKNFGGVFYVFLRGVEPGRPELGIFQDRPGREMIVGLSELLGGTSRFV